MQNKRKTSSRNHSQDGSNKFQPLRQSHSGSRRFETLDLRTQVTIGPIEKIEIPDASLLGLVSWWKSAVVPVNKQLLLALLFVTIIRALWPAYWTKGLHLWNHLLLPAVDEQQASLPYLILNLMLHSNGSFKIPKSHSKSKIPPRQRTSFQIIRVCASWYLVFELKWCFFHPPPSHANASTSSLNIMQWHQPSWIRNNEPHYSFI